ncbi:hypothetical protein [Dysgonomonas sp.]
MYIKEIKEAAIKYAECPLMDIKAMKTMSKIYPQGELAYWIKKRFEYVEEIKEKTNIGQAWTISGCPDLTKMDNPSKIISEYLKDYYSQESLSHLTQSEKDRFAKSRIDTFFRLYLEYRVVDAIIDNLEITKASNKRVSMQKNIHFKDMFVSDKAYQDIIIWLKNNGKLNNSGVFNMGQNEFVELVYALHYKSYLNQKPKAPQIVTFMRELNISPLTQQQVNTIKRKHGNTNFNERLSGSIFYMIVPFSTLS